MSIDIQAVCSMKELLYMTLAFRASFFRIFLSLTTMALSMIFL